MARTTRTDRTGAEQARNRLPELIEAAVAGQATIITRRGRAVAAVVPLEVYEGSQRQQSLLAVAGSGRGLWGPNSLRTLAGLRDEWER